MIYYFVPYSLERNIGKAYNQYMALLPNDNDWGVLMDGDTMFLTFDWGHAIEEVIKKLPDAGLITCLTNRISTGRGQFYNEDSTDIIVHRAIAKHLDKEFRGQYRRNNARVSGFLMAIQKKTWIDVGKFPEASNKILGVDDAFSKKVLRTGKGIYIMKGMYKLHYYRMAEGRKYKDHLRDATIHAEKKSKPFSRRRKLELGLKAKRKRNQNLIKNRRR